MDSDLDDVTRPLRTPRLTLRRAAAGDLDAIWRYRSLSTGYEWMTRTFVDRAAFDEKFGNAPSLAVTLVIELDGRVIGDLMLQIEDGWAQAEVAQRRSVCRPNSAGPWTPITVATDSRGKPSPN